MDRQLENAVRQKAVLLEAWEGKVREEERARIQAEERAMARKRNRNKICGEENPGTYLRMCVRVEKPFAVRIEHVLLLCHLVAN